MTGFSSTFSPPIEVAGVASVEIDTIDLTTASTEVSYAISSGISKVELRNRNEKLLRLALNVGETSIDPYITIYPGELRELIIPSGGVTIYLWCATANQTVEVIKYS